jgi:sugar-phosphatase
VTFSCKAILFDLDGVLVDSTAAVERVWRAWAAAHHLDPDHVIELAHGRRSIETVRLLAPHLDANSENIKVETAEIEDKAGVVALPGASDLLRALPAGRFTIVTSATYALAAARLRYANLPVPDRMITADDVVKGKPHPEPYSKGASLLGFAAADCLVFEDTPPGIQAGLLCGMQVIGLATTYPAGELVAAHGIAASLREVKVEFEAEFEAGLLRLNVNTLPHGKDGSRRA